MKAWKPSVILALCLGAAACRSDPNIALLERELRLQEDRIYQLQDELELCSDELHEARRKLAQAEQAPATSSVSRPTGARSLPAEAHPGALVPEAIPAVEVPIESGDAKPSGAAPAGSPGPGFPVRGVGLQRKPAVVAGSSRQVAAIELNRLATGGFRRGRAAGHEGVMVVIEPRDAQGRIVAAAGQISVVVVDPALPGDVGRIARWDFAAEEAEALLVTDGPAPGLHLELPWPAEPPQNEDLHLFVRYITADGRKLQTDRPIKIELADAPPRTAQPAQVGPMLTGEPGDRSTPAPPPATAAAPTPLLPRGAPAAGDTAAGSSDGRGASPAAESRPAADETAPREAAERPKQPTSGEAPSRTTTAVKRPAWSPERR